MPQQYLLVLSILVAVLAAILVVGGWTDNGYGDLDSAIKPPDTEEDVQDVLSLSTRKMLYERDWEERYRIEDYVNLHYPIDFNAPREVFDRQFEENAKAWERLYQEYVDEVCREYGIPEWQYWQILDEGMNTHWPHL